MILNKKNLDKLETAEFVVSGFFYFLYSAMEHVASLVVSLTSTAEPT
jgi:hypothetical protein